jgi:hypothetical protein
MAGLELIGPAHRLDASNDAGTGQMSAYSSAERQGGIALVGRKQSDTTIHRGMIMKNIVQALLIGSVVAIGSAVVVAADAPDPIVGTWTLNLAKSKFNPGPAPTSQSRTYSQSAEGTSVSVSGVAADGSPISQQATYKYDGKDYPFKGSSDFDSLSLKRVDAHTVKVTQMRGGKAVGTTTRTISADGKVLTLATKGKDAKGAEYDDVNVFDKQ